MSLSPRLSNRSRSRVNGSTRSTDWLQTTPTPAADVARLGNLDEQAQTAGSDERRHAHQQQPRWQPANALRTRSAHRSSRGRRLPDFDYVQIVEFGRRVAQFCHPRGELSDLGTARVLHRGVMRVELDDVQVVVRTVPVCDDRATLRRGRPAIIQPITISRPRASTSSRRDV